jgi:hypothetical protein
MGNVTDTQAILAYYAGAYGPTLRIDIQSENDLEAAITILEGLAQSSAGEVNFADALGALLDGLKEFTLKAVPPHIGRHVQKVSTHVKKPTFHWLEPVETWQRCLDLVESFRRGSLATKYLTPENVGDALVEFAFREERPPRV